MKLTLFLSTWFSWLAWKKNIARMVRLPLMDRLMVLGIRAVVPPVRIGVAIVGFNEREEVLMLRHVFHPATPWGLPGGWLAGGEAPGACALRELREEAGLAADLGPPVHIARDPYPDHIGIAYLGWVRSGTPTPGPEIIEARWFGLSDLPQPLLPFTSQAIAAAHKLHLALRNEAKPQ
jgi:ADP-ribose pyrophosphatase YjhB (NUDIX family)